MTVPIDISVVVPTRNRSGLLATTLRSVLQQQDVNFEVIVVDEASTDDTPAVLAAFADSRLRVIRHDAPRGVSAARNHGAAEARAGWIAFLDDDDLWAPDKLARQLSAARESGASWVYAGHVNINMNDRVTGGAAPPDPDALLRELPQRNAVPGGCSGVIVSKQAFAAAGAFDPQLQPLADWDLWLRLARAGRPAWVCRPLVAYRLHGSQMSLDASRVEAEFRMLAGRDGWKGNPAVLYRYLGWWALRVKNYPEAARLFVRGWRQKRPDYRAPALAADLGSVVRDFLEHRLGIRLPQRQGSGRLSDEDRSWRNDGQAWVDRLVAADPDGGGGVHRAPPRTICLLAGGDRFEDFFDKIGVSLDTFRDEFTGGWLFNYVEALRLAGVRTVLLFMSARVQAAVHFTHVASGASVWILPSPLLHRKVRNAQRRYFPESPALVSAASYLATPLRAFTRVLRQERCDAIVCQAYEHPRFDACVLLGRLLRLPVFATYQGGQETRVPFERAIRRLTVRGASGLIIPSLAESTRVRRTYGVAARKIDPIPNPVEAVAGGAATRQATRAALGISPTAGVAAWHGRVQIPTKGLDVLLDAWERICSARPGADILLLLVGSGRDADELRQRIAANRRVLWIDRYVYDRQQLWSYLSAADLYCIPSRYEGFAVAVLEAMACGLPVVASDAAGVIDVFPRAEDDGGIIVPVGDVDALAGAILRLLDEPELARRLGDAARQHVERDFSLETIGPRLRRFLFPDVRRT